MENLSATSINHETLETMMEEIFFNNDDTVVRKMKQKFNKLMLALSYEQKMQFKSIGEEITEDYKMTKSNFVMAGMDQPTPKQYIYVMLIGGWDAFNLLTVSPYLSNDLEEAVFKYLVSLKSI